MLRLHVDLCPRQLCPSALTVRIKSSYDFQASDWGTNPTRMSRVLPPRLGIRVVSDFIGFGGGCFPPTFITSLRLVGIRGGHFQREPFFRQVELLGGALFHAVLETIATRSHTHGVSMSVSYLCCLFVVKCCRFIVQCHPHFVLSLASIHRDLFRSSRELLARQ